MSVLPSWLATSPVNKSHDSLILQQVPVRVIEAYPFRKYAYSHLYSLQEPSGM